MTTLPEEAVKAAQNELSRIINEWERNREFLNVSPEAMKNFVGRQASALTAAAPFLQGVKADPWGWVIPRGGSNKPIILEASKFDQASAAAEADIHDLGYFPIYTQPAPDTSPRAQALEPDFWSVHSKTGVHIGLWPIKAHAYEALREYEGGTITPLYRATHDHEEGFRQGIEASAKLAEYFEETIYSEGMTEDVYYGISCAVSQVIREIRALSSQPVADKKSDEFVAYRFKHRNDGPHMWEYYQLPVEKSDNPDFVTQALTLKKLLAILNSDQHADRQSQPVADGWLPTHRHRKRGTDYSLIGIGKMQADNWQVSREGFDQSIDMEEVAIYRSVDDGSLWVRPREEFEDGRFEALPASPGASE